MARSRNFMTFLHYGRNKMLMILVAIFMKFTVCFCTSTNGNSTSAESNVCTTPLCLETAESMLETMNTTNKPCSNFYLFACGTFVKHAPVPRGQPYMNTLLTIQNEVNEKLRAHLRHGIKRRGPRTFKLLKKYYNVCLNSRTPDAIQQQKNTALSIFKMLGGWPLLEGESWDETKFDWKNFIYNIRKLGFVETQTLIGAFMSTAIRVYGAKDQKGRVVIDEEKMLKVAEYFGVDELQAREGIQQMFTFQKELAKTSRIISFKDENSHTISSLLKERKKSGWSWFTFLRKYLRNNELDLDGLVYVNLQKFYSLVKVIEKTDKRMVANYVFWILAKDIYSYLEDRVRTIEKEHFVVPKTGRKLWKYCVNYMINNMPVATGALYARKNVNVTWEADANKFVESLLTEFKSFVNKSELLTDDSKEATLLKLDSIQTYLPYPVELLNDTKLDDYFKSLSPSTGDFLKNHLALLGFNYDDRLNRTIFYDEDNNWINYANIATVMAEYQYEANSIEIRGSIIHNRYFNPDKPYYLNYGGLGRIIGHELGHSVDREGRQYGYDGEDLWDNETQEAVNESEKCLINQYHSFKASPRAISLNGTKSFNENFADYIGVKLAYAAYEKWIQQHGEEPVLPGLSFNTRQLFWLNAAHTECHRLRKAGWDRMIPNEHSPGPFRVLGILANIPEFARDFNCKPGSRMNPNERCSLWLEHTKSDE